VVAVITFDGHIIGASFASGDRLVAGRWFRSPFGAFADVMWCQPDGRRVLLAPDERVRATSWPTIAPEVGRFEG
jgi:hypothetical protein